MSKQFKDMWVKLATAIFAITALVTLGLLGTIISLNMLPAKYLVVVVIAVLLVLFLIFMLCFMLPLKKGTQTKKKNKYVYRIVGMLLALTMVFIDTMGITMIGQLQGAITDVIGDEDEVTYEIVSVFVPTGSTAQDITDAREFEFGYTDNFDREYTPKAVNEIKQTLKDSMHLKEYDSAKTMIDDMLAGNIDAVVLNAAYLMVLEGDENYLDISSRIRSIHDVKFEVEEKNDSYEETPINITKDPFIVYISGNDTNYAMKRVRSDVNILAVVNPTTKQVLLLNTPRDYYVAISEAHYREYDKLTHCGIYGLDCSMDTLGNLYGKDIRYYTQVSFKGFTRLIDALGGINVYSDATFIATETNKQIYKGMNYLNGEDALAFVRERKTLPDGDFARGRHQMAVIKAIIQEAMSGAILTRYGAILESMGKCFACNLTNDEISDLVRMQLDDMASWDIQSFTVTGVGKLDYTYSEPGMKLYVTVPDMGSVEHAKNLINKIYRGETITDQDLVYTPAEEN